MRWGWLKAVSKDGDLQPMARVLASVLVTQFSNTDTARCDPSTSTLARCLDTSPDTIKRALKALEAAGWLVRTEGRGRGNHSQIVFLSPGNVVPMTPKTPPSTATKGGKSAPLNKAEKGAILHGKGGKYAPSYNKDKPNMNQRAQPTDKYRHERPMPQLSKVAVNGSEAVTQWNAWLASKGLPSLEQLDRKTSNAQGRGWDVTHSYPPTTADETRYALTVFNWMADQKGLLP